MLILGCDTSSIASGALISLEGSAVDGTPYTGTHEVLGRFETEDTQSHAEVMAPGIRSLLDDAGVRGESLDLILTGRGPGPFTGLRVGIMTARTLGWAWKVPVRGVMSLDAVAESAFCDARELGLERFRVATDARRREVYAAEYRVEEQSYRRVGGPVVGSAAALDDLLADEFSAADRFSKDGLSSPGSPRKTILTAGRGAGLYPESITALTGHNADQPLAEYLVLAAARAGLAQTTENTSPLYLRESDAKVPTARKKATR